MVNTSVQYNSVLPYTSKVLMIVLGVLIVTVVLSAVVTVTVAVAVESALSNVGVANMHSHTQEFV